MVDKILDPNYIIMYLFGNYYIFAALLSLLFIYIAAKYSFNIQLTILTLVAGFLMLTVVLNGFSVWIAFIVAGMGMAATYVFWRYLAP